MDLEQFATNVYFDRTFDCQAAKILPGEYYFTNKDMLIVITYDENGGWWDHVAPPAGDLVGPGTRIPAILVGPHVKKGFVDHTQYDTGSILRLITRRFGLTPLPGLAARDAGLTANGEAKMGDLTNALDF